MVSTSLGGAVLSTDKSFAQEWPLSNSDCHADQTYGKDSCKSSTITVIMTLRDDSLCRHWTLSRAFRNLCQSQTIMACLSIQYV